MITIVLATRGGATDFAGPTVLLEEMNKKAKNPKNFEVIIRGDDDDPYVETLRKELKRYKFKFNVTVITGSRGRGYEDLHKFYNECYMHAAPDHKIIFSLPEDVTIAVNHWDQFLIESYEAAKKQFGHSVFTMHQSIAPGLCENYDSCLETPDSFPIYTREWMDALGGFCHTGANDSWVQATHHFLLSEFGMHARYFLPELPFIRHASQEYDSVASIRWANQRLRNHELMRRKRVKNMIKAQARNVYLHMTAQLEEKHNGSYKPEAMNVYDATNYAINKHGPATMLYRMYYEFLRGAEEKEIREDLQFVLTASHLILRLKSTVPCMSDITEYIYKPHGSEVKYIAPPESVHYIMTEKSDRREPEPEPQEGIQQIKEEPLKLTEKQEFDTLMINFGMKETLKKYLIYLKQRIINGKKAQYL